MPSLLDLSAAVDVYSEWVDAAGMCFHKDSFTVKWFVYDGSLICFQTPSRKKTQRVKVHPGKGHASLRPAPTMTKTTADTRERALWQMMTITELLTSNYSKTRTILLY